MISLILVPIGAIIFLRLNKFYQFLVLSLSALLPFSFGNFRSIPDLLIIEWLTIIVFVSLLNKLIPVNSVNKEIEKIKFKGVEVFIFAIIILIVWAAISFVNNELSKQVNVVSDTTGSKRLYFNIINNIVLFFTTIIFIVNYYEKIDFEKFFKFILCLSLIIGVLRIFSYFLGVNLPLLAGTFKYDPKSMSQYGGVAYRFGGMTDIVAIGIPALFSLYIIKGKFNLLAFFLLFIFLFLSGGRTVMVGTVIAIIVFSFLFLPKNFIYLILAGGLLLLALALFAPQSLIEGQLNRLSSMNSGNFLGQDIMRGSAWLMYLRNFVAHPILGKGISQFNAFIYSSNPGVETFVRQAQFAGGHGSYFSLLSTFGIGGILYFLIMLWGGIILAFRKIKEYIELDNIKTAIAVFCFMLLFIKAVDFATSDNGLDVPILFFTTGFIVSLRVMQNKKALE